MQEFVEAAHEITNVSMFEMATANENIPIECLHNSRNSSFKSIKLQPPTLTRKSASGSGDGVELIPLAKGLS
jgi:hypothetical protein